MAGVKIPILVKLLAANQIAEIWIDNPNDVIAKIKAMAGVNMVRFKEKLPMYAYIDPRYDADEVTDEIRSICTQ